MHCIQLRSATSQSISIYLKTLQPRIPKFLRQSPQHIFKKKLMPTTLTLIRHLTDTDEFITSGLSFDTKFLSSTAGIRIPSDGYVALPGFINCGMQSSQELFINQHVKSGVSTIALLSNLESRNACVKKFELVGEDWVCGIVKIKSTSSFSYRIESGREIAEVETLPPQNRLDGVLFGSGNDQLQNPDIFSRLENRDDPLVALKDLTINAAKALDLPLTGIIKQGWNADLVLFKIHPSWDLSTTRIA